MSGCGGGGELETLASTSGAELRLVQSAGSFVGQTLGTLPKDIVGILGGDWLQHQRIRNIAKLSEKTHQILKDRGMSMGDEPAPPRIAIPIFKSAQDESRDDLQDLWAKLLATSLDISKRDYIRQSFIETLTHLDPYDARLLSLAWRHGEGPASSKKRKINIQKVLKLSDLTDDAVILSAQALKTHGLANWNPSPGDVSLTAYGREFMRACEGESN